MTAPERQQQLLCKHTKKSKADAATVHSLSEALLGMAAIGPLYEW